MATPGQGRIERRLAAILAADVAGYSRLMGADEAGTARVLRKHRAAIDPIVASHGGRIVKTTGDGVLLDFPSIVAAVECAIAVQKLMAERNADVPEDRRMLFRVGINLGDVLIEGDDILGDGVNVAARLEGIAEPGGICISEDAYRQVQGKLDAMEDATGAPSSFAVWDPRRLRASGRDGGTVMTESPSPLRMLLSRHTRRREFITLLGSTAIAWPLAVRAQQPDRMRRIGVLTPFAESDPEGQVRMGAFRQGLEKLGWTEGRNIRIDYHWAPGDADRLPSYAKELVGLTPDVIVSNSTLMLAALKNETQTVAIVFVQVPDPVEGGFVASLSRPGGNITGVTNFEYTLGGKWLELLKEIAPRVARVTVIPNPGDRASSEYMHAIEAVAPSFGVQLIAADVHDATEIERAIGASAREANAGLIVLPGPFTAVYREPIVALAAQHRLPAVYPYRYFVTSGGLISYGVETVDLYRRAALYVDRILKGEKPADLPVQAPTKFEFVINLKTAKALGLKIPESFLLRADEVIE
jgi:putative ABC transport system substrate-binding protein